MPDRGKSAAIPASLVDLAWLSQKSVYLETVGETAVYQVQDGWPHAVLKEAGKIDRAQNVHDFECAMQDPAKRAIYVTASATITPEIARRIILRNPLPKTIFWEVKKEQT